MTCTLQMIQPMDRAPANSKYCTYQYCIIRDQRLNFALNLWSILSRSGHILKGCFCVKENSQDVTGMKSMSREEELKWLFRAGAESG